MYRGFTRFLNPTDNFYLHILNNRLMPGIRDVHDDCKTVYRLKTFPVEWLT